MSDGTGGSVEVKLDGAHLRVDARPARLVSLLKGGGGDPVLTAQREAGGSHTEAVPAAARQVTFQVDGDLTVEATRGSNFVALSEASGRQVVVAFNGEVTVLPKGEGGDRFALAAHEALLVPADGGEPRVVPSDDLSDDDQDEISAAMEAAALGTVPAAAAAGTETDELTEALPAVESETKSEPGAKPEPETKPDSGAKTAAAAGAGAVAGAAAAKAAAAAKKGPATTPARTGNQKRGKKGKKGRPQAPAKKAAPLVPAAGAAGAAGAAAGAAATKATTPAKKATPVKKATAPAKKGAGKPPAKGGHGDDSYEDTPGDRRFIIGAVALAALIAIVLAVFVLSGGDDDELAGPDATTTTEAEPEPTTTEAEPTTTEAPATTVAAAVTTAAPTTAAPTTTAPATTTTARATTTTAAPVAAYAIEPKSCVQNANNSITYTASITNNSTVPFDYTIRVVFLDGERTVASTDANVARLAAGRSVDFTATGNPNRSLTSGGNCDVERVEARPSGS